MFTVQTNNPTADQRPAISNTELHLTFPSDPDYAEARVRFLMAASKGDNHSVRLSSSGPKQQPHYIDTSYFGDPDPKRVMIVLSGTHGVELFHGAAIQFDLLKAEMQIPAQCGVLFVHGVNAFGAAFLRRTTQHNVDQNRNCFTGPFPTGVPPEFQKLDPLLHPKSDRDLTAALQEVRRILTSQQGQEAQEFIDAVTPGQYGMSDGLFFGGALPTENFALLKQFIPQRLKSPDRIVVVDFHSGLGNYGKQLTFLKEWRCDPLKPLLNQGSQTFAGCVDLGTMAYASKVRGSIGDGIADLFPSANVLLVAAEYGTKPPEEIFPALVEENYDYVLRGGNHLGDPRANRSRMALKEAFFPTQYDWRREVLIGGSATLRKAADLAFLD